MPLGGYTKASLWDCVVAEWFGGKVISSYKAEVGRIVSYFRQLGATPDEIRKRRARIARAWGEGKDTARATIKHWGQFANEPVDRSSPARVHAKPGKYDHIGKEPVDHGLGEVVGAAAEVDGKRAEGVASGAGEGASGV